VRRGVAFGLRGEVEVRQQILIRQIRQLAESGARDGVHPPSIPSSFSAVRVAL
jgi:hypothetical protein